MRVCCWNVFNENRDSARLGKMIDDICPDIVLFQELVEPHAKLVKQRFSNCVFANDYILDGEMSYLAIASNRPLLNLDIIQHFPPTKEPASRFAKSRRWVEFLESVSADILLRDDVRLRLIVAHLSAGCGPTVRMKELEMCSAHITGSVKCLFAADFNCFSSPVIAPFLAIPFNFDFPDFFIFERRKLEAWFRERNFRFSVRGVTIPKFYLQYDYIFVNNVQQANSFIHPNSYGSDHRPIVLDIFE